MLDTFVEAKNQWKWLELAVAGKITLDRVFNNYSYGSLIGLSDTGRYDVDSDLDPWVERWARENLATRDLVPKTRLGYERHVRLLIPAGIRFPRSQFNEDYLRAALARLTGAKHDRSALLGTSAKRRIVVAWKLFFKYARRRVPIDIDPFDAEWIPRNASPRSMFYEYGKVRTVLGHMTGEHLAAMALVFGSGIELGALLALTRMDVGNAAERTVIAHGTKSTHREDRTIFVDAWAWKIFYPHAETKELRQRVFTTLGPDGRILRTAFYRAQVAAGFTSDAPLCAKWGKERWSRVEAHTIHDARHSYCINRSLGLDGEEPQDAIYCAYQLGHGDEQMVLKVYKKARIKERLRLFQLRRSMQRFAHADEAPGSTKSS